MTKKPVNIKNDLLLNRIGLIINEARQRTVQAVNTMMVKTYWEIGREIIEHELKGSIRAEYGEQSLKTLSTELVQRYGKGFSYPNLRKMRQFYYTYEICSTPSIKSDAEKISTSTLDNSTKQMVQTTPTKSFLSEKMLSRLSWSHICLLLAVSDKDARSFYEIEIAENGWSVRETKRQIESMLFERLALSKDKKGLMELAAKGQRIEKPEDALKDPYVLEFLGLPENERWHESDLEQALMDRLQKFLLELGKGFMFVGRQTRITINNEHYRIDLV
ncbi:MAG TPA: DUF1016 family protein, partial [Caldithrix sp.]|nr:DUF1016 family protein [Caldithrix sp.]